jgi:ketosteroid isomerase-like protein
MHCALSVIMVSISVIRIPTSPQISRKIVVNKKIKLLLNTLNMNIMKTSILGLLLVVISFGAFAQNSTSEKEIIELSKNKWQWMADKDVEKLATLFHDKSKFVHMSGSWKKERELEIIESGSIWYKQANVHDVAVEVFGNTAIAWNRITLVAHVRGNDVTTEFTVTEVYQKEGSDWKLLDLTFSSVRDTHEIEH